MVKFQYNNIDIPFHAVLVSPRFEFFMCLLLSDYGFGCPSLSTPVKWDLIFADLRKLEYEIDYLDYPITTFPVYFVVQGRPLIIHNMQDLHSLQHLIWGFLELEVSKCHSITGYVPPEKLIAYLHSYLDSKGE